ncbi:MAG: flagellar motor protein [Nitrosomonadales bacterium]|nr:flagellar motor protein [Nitrosomonadales bacterium]
MDKLSFFGLLIALTGVIGGQLLEGGAVVVLMQAAAFFIVFGGTLGAVMLQSTRPVFFKGIRMGGWAFVPPKSDFEQTIQQIVDWSVLARRDGVLMLDGLIDGISDPFVKRGVQLLVDGNSAEKIRDVLEVDIDTYEQLHWQSARVWESAGGYAPTIGIIGAVLGLVHVMQSLGEPSKLGAGIAVAFISTIYGVGLANLVFLPIANKLKSILMGQVKRRTMIIDGLTMLANGEHPRFIEIKLRGYLD